MADAKARDLITAIETLRDNYLMKLAEVHDDYVHTRMLWRSLQVRVQRHNKKLTERLMRGGCNSWCSDPRHWFLLHVLREKVRMRVLSFECRTAPTHEEPSPRPSP
jgi:hypothetical protein